MNRRIEVKTESLAAAAAIWRQIHSDISAVGSAVPRLTQEAAAACAVASLAQALEQLARDERVEAQVDAEATQMMASTMANAAGEYRRSDTGVASGVLSAAAGNLQYNELLAEQSNSPAFSPPEARPE